MRRRRGGGKDITSNDVYLNSFAMLAVVAYLLLQLINPPAKESEGEPPPGSMSVYSSWANGPIDIDQWTRDPTGEIVGFSVRSAKNGSLLKDDLGSSNDLPGAANFENTYFRNILAGEYTVNVMCYTCPTLPVDVQIEVRISKPGQDMILLASTRVTLTQRRQEISAIRFKLDRDGGLVPGSVHNVYVPLYYGSGRQ